MIVAGLDPGDESTSVRPVEIGPGAGVAVALGALVVAIVALMAAARRPRRTTL